jgi:hypothetical protein
MESCTRCDWRSSVWGSIVLAVPPLSLTNDDKGRDINSGNALAEEDVGRMMTLLVPSHALPATYRRVLGGGSGHWNILPSLSLP